MNVKLRPMSEAPTAAGEREFLVLVEYDDGSQCWLSVTATGDGHWGVCGGETKLVINESGRGGIVTCYTNRVDSFDVLGWHPAPGVPVYVEVTP